MTKAARIAKNRLMGMSIEDAKYLESQRTNSIVGIIWLSWTPRSTPSGSQSPP